MWFGTSKLPEIRTQDNGLWRRLKLNKKDRIRNAIQKDKYDLSMIVDLLPCNKCKWRYSICCPKCNWNRNGKYKVY